MFDKTYFCENNSAESICNTCICVSEHKFAVIVGDLSDYHPWLVVILSTFSSSATHNISLGNLKVLIRQLFLHQIYSLSLQNAQYRS